MKQELINSIVLMLKRSGIEHEGIAGKLELIMEPYAITKAETALTVRSISMNEGFIQKFLACKIVDGCTERTLKYYDRCLRFVLKHIGKIADEITTDDIRLYIAKRQHIDGVKATTADNELRVMRSFYQFMSGEAMIQKNPLVRLKKVRGPKVAKEAFTEMEVERIRAACRTKRETAIVELLLSTGCRVSEAANIKLSELKGDRIIVHGKGRKDRTVFLNAKAQLALEMYLKERSDNNQYLFAGGKFAPRDGKAPCKSMDFYKYPKYLTENALGFASIEHIVRGIGKRGGVENCHPHRFRRTCATFALKRGMGLSEVSRMLGHESIATTQIYLDISDDAVESAHKKFMT